jgi:hypothetical protein
MEQHNMLTPAQRQRQSDLLDLNTEIGRKMNQVSFATPDASEEAKSLLRQRKVVRVELEELYLASLA